MGKGSRFRPSLVSLAEWEAAYARIFGWRAGTDRGGVGGSEAAATGVAHVATATDVGGSTPPSGREDLLIGGGEIEC